MNIRNKKLTKLSQLLRTNMTKEEKRLWYDFLKNHEFKFSRQKVAGEYILDFYCSELRLAIEIDGIQHNLPDVKSHDLQRTADLEEMGIRVFRLSNEIINRDFASACNLINNQINIERTPE